VLDRQRDNQVLISLDSATGDSVIYGIDGMRL
jgi:hypothetical protein